MQPDMALIRNKIMSACNTRPRKPDKSRLVSQTDLILLPDAGDDIGNYSAETESDHHKAIFISAKTYLAFIHT